MKLQSGPAAGPRGGALFVSGAPADDADLRATVEELLTAGAQAAVLVNGVADAATVAGLINAALTHLAGWTSR
jgi:hypothetical protein